MTPKLKREWEAVVKKNPRRQKQNPEELFCMAYAATYAKHKPIVHYHPAWAAFIKTKVPEVKNKSPE
jgi:hypothetical protein